MSTIFIDPFTECTTIESLEKALVAALKSFNILTFSFTYYGFHPQSNCKLKYDFASNNLLDWHKHFIEENYGDVDTTLEKVYQVNVPTFWQIDEQIESAKYPREKKMREDSKRFGMDCGLSIPLHGIGANFAILMVAQRQGEKCLEHWQNLQYELFLLGHWFYYNLGKMLSLEKAVSNLNLSQREAQCLICIGKELSLDAIAREMGISERTVNFHIQNINKKLGAKNKYQSYNRALELGIIEK